MKGLSGPTSGQQGTKEWRRKWELPYYWREYPTLGVQVQGSGLLGRRFMLGFRLEGSPEGLSRFIRLGRRDPVDSGPSLCPAVLAACPDVVDPGACH